MPVDPDANLVPAMKAGAFGLAHGKILMLFPEGERSIDGTVKRFKKGAPILARHQGVPIVPVAIQGAFEIWPRNRSFNWRALVPFGGAPRPDRDRSTSDVGETESHADAANRLRDAVEQLWLGLSEDQRPDRHALRTPPPSRMPSAAGWRRKTKPASATAAAAQSSHQYSSSARSSTPRARRQPAARRDDRVGDVAIAVAIELEVRPRRRRRRCAAARRVRAATRPAKVRGLVRVLTAGSGPPRKRARRRRRGSESRAR